MVTTVIEARRKINAPQRLIGAPQRWTDAPLRWIDAPQRLIRAPPILDAPLHVVKKLHVASKIEEPKISGCTPEIARFLSVFKNVVKKLHLGLNLYDAWYKFFNIPLNYSPPAAPMTALVNKNLSSYKSVKHMILHNSTPIVP
jgi:hypothetical protein